jgi:hypothetical protein
MRLDASGKGQESSWVAPDECRLDVILLELGCGQGVIEAFRRCRRSPEQDFRGGEVVAGPRRAASP